MSLEILESSVRAFVAEGSEIDRSHIIPGLQPEDPPDGLHASVHLLSERPVGRNVSYQYVGDTESFTVEDVVVESRYSINWYRTGALAAAMNFYTWARSETGQNWAAAAITDGRIAGASVYAGGSGYEEGDVVQFNPAPSDEEHNVENGDTIATGLIVVKSNGEAHAVAMRTFGGGYWDIPNAAASGGGSGAEFVPRGFGFTIKEPLMIRNLTGMFADDFEERAQIDLTICHTRIWKDSNSGRVETLDNGE